MRAELPTTATDVADWHERQAKSLSREVKKLPAVAMDHAERDALERAMRADIAFHELCTALIRSVAN